MKQWLLMSVACVCVMCVLAGCGTAPADTPFDETPSAVTTTTSTQLQIGETTVVDATTTMFVNDVTSPSEGSDVTTACSDTTTVTVQEYVPATTTTTRMIEPEIDFSEFE